MTSIKRFAKLIEWKILFWLRSGMCFSTDYNTVYLRFSAISSMHKRDSVLKICTHGGESFTIEGADTIALAEANYAAYLGLIQ